MKTIKIQTEIQYFESEKELSLKDKALVDKAYEQASKAYAPYSDFKVGCAILLENGEIIGGSNQENASYPAGICAERTALSACSSIFPGVKPLTIAIVVNDRTYVADSPLAPCGICRQTISETENRYGKIDIIFPAPNKGFYKMDTIERILPFMFDSKML